MAERRTARSTGAGRVRRRERKNVPRGNAYIQSSFNNTIVTITDPDGNVLTWGSSGAAGFKGSRKSTPYAAGLAADSAARKAMEHGMRQVSVFVRGPGGGRVRRSHAHPPQRLPPAEEEARLKPAMARYTGPVCRLCRRAGMK